MHGARTFVSAFLIVALGACAAAPASLAPATAAATAAPSSSPAAPAASASPSRTASSTVAPSVPADAILVTVSVTGGECANGPCGAEYVVYGDGRVQGPDGGPARISDAAAAHIAGLAAATDWDAVRAVPFTGECPTAFDGQKHVYAFPAAGGDVVLDSCEFDVSGVEVVKAIDAALFGG